MCVGNLPRVIEVGKWLDYQSPNPQQWRPFWLLQYEKERREVGRVALQCEKP